MSDHHQMKVEIVKSCISDASLLERKQFQKREVKVVKGKLIFSLNNLFAKEKRTSLFLLCTNRLQNKPPLFSEGLILMRANDYSPRVLLTSNHLRTGSQHLLHLLDIVLQIAL